VTYHSLPALRALVRPRARPGRAARGFGDFGQEIDDAGEKQGASSGADAATGLLGPEAAPVGAVIGGYVGRHSREWAKGIFDTVAGWFGGGSAPCECQLGACNDSDDFDPGKYTILRGQIDPVVATIIDHVVVDRMIAIRQEQQDLDESNRTEICMKLAAYAQAAREHWAAPPPPPHPGGKAWNPFEGGLPPYVQKRLAVTQKVAECSAQGLVYDGASCVPIPHLTKPTTTPPGSLPVVGPQERDRGDVPRLPRTPTQTAVASAVSVASVAGLAYSVWRFIPWKALI